MARAFEVKRQAERSQPDLALSQAYRRYWELPETEPLATFTAILAEIGILEAQRNPAMVIGILEAEAQRFHRETGLCPYCRLAGPLHHGPESYEGNR